MAMVQIKASDLRAVQDVFVEHAVGREAHRLLNAIDAALASDPGAALMEPLTREQAAALVNAQGDLSVVVRAPLIDLIEHQYEDDYEEGAFADYLGMLMIDSTLISGFEYHIVGYEGNDLFIKVTADISEFLAEED